MLLIGRERMAQAAVSWLNRFSPVVEIVWIFSNFGARLPVSYVYTSITFSLHTSDTYICIFAENEMPWSGFQVTWKCIHQHQRIIILIDPVNLHLVNTKICHHHKLFVRCHTDTS